TSPSARTVASGRSRRPDRPVTARDLGASHPPPILPHKGGRCRPVVVAGSTPHTRWSTLPLVGRVGEGVAPNRIGRSTSGMSAHHFPRIVLSAPLEPLLLAAILRHRLGDFD